MSVAHTNMHDAHPAPLYILYNATAPMLYIPYNTLGGRTMKLKLKKIGNSTGLILPKELLARLGLKQGDEVFVTEGPGGFVVSRTNDETFSKGVEIARKAMGIAAEICVYTNTNLVVESLPSER